MTDWGNAITITLTDAGNDPRPLPIRLRQFLKVALRRWKLRCTDIAAVPAIATETHPTSTDTTAPTKTPQIAY